MSSPSGELYYIFWAPHWGHARSQAYLQRQAQSFPRQAGSRQGWGWQQHDVLPAAMAEPSCRRALIRAGRELGTSPRVTATGTASTFGPTGPIKSLVKPHGLTGTETAAWASRGGQHCPPNASSAWNLNRLRREEDARLCCPGHQG